MGDDRKAVDCLAPRQGETIADALVDSVDPSEPIGRGEIDARLAQDAVARPAGRPSSDLACHEDRKAPKDVLIDLDSGKRSTSAYGY